jgi:hypothetical protein
MKRTLQNKQSGGQDIDPALKSFIMGAIAPCLVKSYRRMVAGEAGVGAASNETPKKKRPVKN